MIEKLNKDSQQTLYSQLYTILTNQIESGLYGIGEKIPSTRELMDRYSLSMKTVRSAIAELEADGYIRSVPYKGSYVDSRGIHKKQTKGNVIGILMKRNGRKFHEIGSDPIFSKLLYYIEQHLRSKGYYLIQLYSDDENLDIYTELKNVLDVVSGFIFLYTIDPELIALANRQDTPSVAINPVCDIYDADVVMIDREKAFYDATKLLVDQGHRKIVYVDATFRNTIGYYDRVRGFTRAMQEAGLEVNDRSLIHIESWSISAAERYFSQLEEREIATAYVTTNDVLAIGIIKALTERGLEIPRDVSVIGGKDTQLATAYSPALTSINYRDSEITQIAITQLLERIHGSKDSFRKTYLYASLSIRETT
jgi:DNA-binding LacI/PurR family transcriptional regulator